MVVPDLPIWKKEFAVRLVDEAILNVLSVELKPIDQASLSLANWKVASPVPALLPIVVRPVLSTLKRVDTTDAAVVDPMAKSVASLAIESV